MGADIVVHSGTKFIGGHHDVISGFTIVKDEEIAAKLRLTYKTVGACLSAMDSWLVIRGVKTFGSTYGATSKRMPLLLLNG